MKLNFLSAGELDSPCLDFKSLDTLSFYETAEIGTLRAVGEYVIGLLFRLSFTFSLFYRDFQGSVESFKYFPKNLRCVKKRACRRNNECLESRLLRPAGSVTVGGRQDDNVLLMIKDSQRRMGIHMCLTLREVCVIGYCIEKTETYASSVIKVA